MGFRGERVRVNACQCLSMPTQWLLAHVALVMWLAAAARHLLLRVYTIAFTRPCKCNANKQGVCTMHMHSQAESAECSWLDDGQMCVSITDIDTMDTLEEADECACYCDSIAFMHIACMRYCCLLY